MRPPKEKPAPNKRVGPIKPGTPLYRLVEAVAHRVAERVRQAGHQK